MIPNVSKQTQMNVLEVMMHFMWSRVALMSGRESECEEGSQPTWRNVAWMQPKRVRQRLVLSHVSAMLICVSVTSSRIILSAGDQRERWFFRVSVFVRLLVIFYLLTESLSVWSFTPTSCFRFRLPDFCGFMTKRWSFYWEEFKHLSVK